MYWESDWKLKKSYGLTIKDTRRELHQLLEVILDKEIVVGNFTRKNFEIQGGKLLPVLSIDITPKKVIPEKGDEDNLSKKLDNMEGSKLETYTHMPTSAFG